MSTPRVVNASLRRLPPALVMISAFLPLLRAQERQVLGAELASGMELVYEADGVRQPAWLVDSVDHHLAERPGNECARFRLRRGPAPAPMEEVRVCVSGDTLFAWNRQRGEWRPQRPLAPGMELVLRVASGDTIRFRTGQFVVDTIDGRTITAIATSVLTVDSLGRPRRRLQERYAPGLVTATQGWFEVPDTAAAGGWITERRFRLVGLR